MGSPHAVRTDAQLSVRVVQCDVTCDRSFVNCRRGRSDELVHAAKAESISRRRFTTSGASCSSRSARFSFNDSGQIIPLPFCSVEFKELEIVVLRHELTIIHRTHQGLSLTATDRLFLAALRGLLRRVKWTPFLAHQRRSADGIAGLLTRRPTLRPPNADLTPSFARGQAGGMSL
jgi:hypothetical protein